MVYYLRQHLTILSQIFRQLPFIAPQVSILPPPAPSPAFNPLSSGVRVNLNTFWFMVHHDVFSLLAAILAILVQKWVHDYMHVFQ